MPQVCETAKGIEIGKSKGRYIYWICHRCGNGRWIKYEHPDKKGFTGLCRSCYQAEIWKGDKHWNWKGGRRLADYILVYTLPNDKFREMANSRGYILEHRLVMAKHLGRLLKHNEVVHHLNGIMTDNRVQNLAIVDSQNHPRHTLFKILRERIRDLEKPIDGEK